MQSLSNLYTRLECSHLAIMVLETTYKEQVEYYGTSKQADVAKTLHYLGDALKSSHPFAALEKYLEAFNIKAELYDEASSIYNVTKNAIIDLLPEVLQQFPFNWNDYTTIAPSEKQLSTILTCLKMFESELHEKKGVAAQNEIARFQYRLGTYYLHVTRDPGAALDALYQAKTLKGWQLAWVEVQLAFAFQQRMFACNKAEDEAALLINYKRAMIFVNGVISLYSDQRECELYPADLLGYAYCVKALIIYERKDATSLEEAIHTYKLALDWYDKNNLHDDQYARAKCRYAMMLGENKNVVEAHKIFKELKAYWAAHAGTVNPYKERFESCYKEFKKNLPVGYNPKVFKSAPVQIEDSTPETTYGFKVG